MLVNGAKEAAVALEDPVAEAVASRSWEVAHSPSNGKVSVVAKALALPSVAQLFHIFKGIDAHCLLGRSIKFWE